MEWTSVDQMYDSSGNRDNKMALAYSDHVPDRAQQEANAAAKGLTASQLCSVDWCHNWDDAPSCEGLKNAQGTCHAWGASVGGLDTGGQVRLDAERSSPSARAC